MAERRFSDRDMNAIIQRAAALQLEGSVDKSAGVTLDQIQQAASELGISADMVAQAADEIGTGNQPAGRSVFGGPTSAEYSRTADGIVPEGELPGLLKEIRRLTGRTGYPKSIGNAFEWQSNQPDGLLVTFTPRNGKTLIDVRATFGQWIGVCIVLPLMISLMLGFAALGEFGPEFGVAVLVILQLVCFAACRELFGRISRAKSKSAQDLAVALENYVEQEAEAVVKQQASAEQASTPKIHQTLIG